MVVAKVRPAHVPVEVLGLQVEREHVRQDGVHRAGDVAGRAALRSVGVASGATCRRLRSAVLFADCTVILVVKAARLRLMALSAPLHRGAFPLRMKGKPLGP